MELKDLKTGMVVELRDGNRYVVIANSAATLGMNIEKDDSTYFYLACSTFIIRSLGSLRKL